MPSTSSSPPSRTWIGPMCSRNGPWFGNGLKPSGTSMRRGTLEDRVLAGQPTQRLRVEEQREQALLHVHRQPAHLLEDVGALGLLARQASEAGADVRVVEHAHPAVVRAQGAQPRVGGAGVEEGV